VCLSFCKLKNSDKQNFVCVLGKRKKSYYKVLVPGYSVQKKVFQRGHNCIVKQLRTTQIKSISPSLILLSLFLGHLEPPVKVVAHFPTFFVALQPLMHCSLLLPLHPLVCPSSLNGTMKMFFSPSCQSCLAFCIHSELDQCMLL